MIHSFSWFLQMPSPSAVGLIPRSYMGFWKSAGLIATPKAGGLDVSMFVRVFKCENHSEGVDESLSLKASGLEASAN